MLVLNAFEGIDLGGPITGTMVLSYLLESGDPQPAGWTSFRVGSSTIR